MPRLFHLSENPGITRFIPHVAATSTEAEAYVWAIDEAHAPSYWFPRDCPRVCYWNSTRRVHTIETAWLDRVRACRLYIYEFDATPFRLKDACAGYWIAREEVRPNSVVEAGDLVVRHAEAGIELRVVDNLWPAIDAAVASGHDFSIIRKMNAQPRAG